MNKPKLYLNPNCPRFAPTPTREDGSFDNEKFGQLLAMQERNTPLSEFIEVMQGTTMEDTMHIRQRAEDEYETNPANAPLLTDEIRAAFDVQDGQGEDGL
jgi:hypothetical protein